MGLSAVISMASQQYATKGLEKEYTIAYHIQIIVADRRWFFLSIACLQRAYLTHSSTFI